MASQHSSPLFATWVVFPTAWMWDLDQLPLGMEPIVEKSFDPALARALVRRAGPPAGLGRRRRITAKVGVPRTRKEAYVGSLS
jgi:hypothetical protein